MSDSGYTDVQTIQREHTHPVIKRDKLCEERGRGIRTRVFGPIVYRTPHEIDRWVQVGTSLADALAGSPRCIEVLDYAKANDISVANAVVALVNRGLSA